jgi:hypothetical protein
VSLRAWSWGLLLGPIVFAAGPIAAVSCSQPANPDGGSDSGMDSAADSNAPGPCQNGTIQLVDCEPNDAGIVTERFTDEACDGLDTAESRMPVMHDDTQAPAVDAPTEGQTLPGAVPFTFQWHTTGFARARPAAMPRAFAWRDDLARWSQMIPEAQAHCAPFGGVAFAVTFTASNGQQLLRAETASRSYTPTTDAWMRLRAAVGTITMNVEVARFSDNVVTEGPYDQMTPRHFTIAP